VVATHTFFIFTPDPWGRKYHFDDHIFQMGWFNHQAVIGFGVANHLMDLHLPFRVDKAGRWQLTLLILERMSLQKA